MSHPGLFGGLIHVVLQGLMKRQPLLRRGSKRENPPVMKSRHLRTSVGQRSGGLWTSGQSVSLTTFGFVLQLHTLIRKGSLPFILGCVLGTEVEGLEFVRGRFQLDAGLLGAIRLLSHHVSLQVDPT